MNVETDMTQNAHKVILNENTHDFVCVGHRVYLVAECLKQEQLVTPPKFLYKAKREAKLSQARTSIVKATKGLKNKGVVQK